MSHGYNKLSSMSINQVQALGGEIVNFMVNAQGEMYFHHNHERYYVDKVKPKSLIPKALTGGLLDFPDRKKPLSIRGQLHFLKNHNYYLLAFASKSAREAWAMVLGEIN